MEKLLKIKAIKSQPANLLHGLLDGNPFTAATVKLCPILLFVIL